MGLRFAFFAVVAAIAGCGAPKDGGSSTAATPGAGERTPRYWSPVVARVEQLARAELERLGIPALSIALIAGGATVGTTTLGFEDEARLVPASRATVWRAGSVSKMFTDLAVMRLVESGQLDLDAPVTRYLPDFGPRNPFTTPITLRQLMAHRSGLVREPPVGNYFDATSPTLAATIDSLDGTTLVYAPATRTKYSNAGIAVVGRVLEAVTHRAFADQVRDDVLAPMGLAHSAFVLTPELKPRLAAARMWTYWGATSRAPQFELGMAPCGSLYTTIDDLAAAARIFLADGVGPRGRVVRKETLAEMWKPQFATGDARSGFGLGFFVDEFAGTRRVGHDGAIYGFSTILALLPELDVAVVAVCSKDVAHGALAKITDDALACLAKAARGQPLPPPPAALADLGKARATKLAGRYRSADGRRAIELLEQAGELWLDDRSRRARLRATVDEPAVLVADDLIVAGPRLRVAEEGKRVVVDGVELARVPDSRPPPPPDAWLGLIGEYGFDHNVLHVFEDQGELHALIEWFFDYTLTRESDDVWAFPDHGLYFGEKIVFARGADGVAREAVAAGVSFPRRQVGTPEGVTFRILPTVPIGELRVGALSAKPPEPEVTATRAAELVDLARIDPTLRFDVRYASTDNFLSTRFYDEPRAFLQRPAADALRRAQGRVGLEGFGLLIHDAYRPWYVTKMFWDATPPEHHEMVADPAKGSRHNRGCAVDLTLCELSTGKPVRMPSGYDEFSLRANPWYPGGTSEERWLRDLLRRCMEAEGFTVYEHEWWHFDFAQWRDYPVMNLKFAEIPDPPPPR
jgi:CubicO group peptidase (beta-lactamase class C family)/D-alanyl-D-alanine dipeptidase